MRVFCAAALALAVVQTVVAARLWDCPGGWESARMVIEFPVPGDGFSFDRRQGAPRVRSAVRAPVDDVNGVDVSGALFADLRSRGMEVTQPASPIYEVLIRKMMVWRNELVEEGFIFGDSATHGGVLGDLSFFHTDADEHLAQRLRPRPTDRTGYPRDLARR